MVRLKGLVVVVAAVAAIAIGASAFGGAGDFASGAGYWDRQNASVGFEARGQTALVADGEFDFRRANGVGRGVGFHGDVNCIHVEGTPARAWLRIVVTESTDPSHLAGAIRIAYVEDNGDGQSGARDEFNLRNPDPIPDPQCDRNPNDQGFPIRGNIVLEDG